MNYAVIPVLSLLLLLILAAASLPWLAVAENRLAERSGRSLFRKSALQMTQLGVLLQAALFLALGADFFLDGRIVRYCAGPLRLPWLLAVLGVGLQFLASLSALVLGAGKSGRGTPGQVPLVVAGLAGTAAAAICVLLSWIFLRGAYVQPSVMEHPGLTELARTMLGQKPVLPALYALLSLILAIVGGRGLTLVWYVIRRNRADYGRDYYNIVVAAQARKVARASGLVLLPLTVVLLSLTQEFSLSRLPFVLPLQIDQAMLALSLLTLCLPLAVICWHVLARAELPLRRKSLIVLAPLLVWVWYFAQLGKLWL